LNQRHGWFPFLADLFDENPEIFIRGSLKSHQTRYRQSPSNVDKPSAHRLTDYLQNQQKGRYKVVKQIKNINRFAQLAVFQHYEFLQYMGHGPKREQEHQNGKKNQNTIGQSIKPTQHGESLRLKGSSVCFGMIL
jgi:hypothetical protein